MIFILAEVSPEVARPGTGALWLMIGLFVGLAVVLTLAIRHTRSLRKRRNADAERPHNNTVENADTPSQNDTRDFVK